MEYQHKLLLVTAILVAVAIYIVLTSGPVAAPQGDSSEAEMLLARSAGFGRDLADYSYAYSENSDGFRVSYTLVSSNGSRLMTVENPLSLKKVYMLPNDTIFCIRYNGNESCASVKGNAEMSNYVAFAASKFFNETTILRSKESMEALISKGYLKAGPEIENASVGTFECGRVSYTIDYSNATVNDAAMFGIGAQSPKIYSLTRCIDRDTWFPYETTLSYNDSGVLHTKTSRALSFREEAGAIEAPGLSGSPIAEFSSEREKQMKLATCYTGMQGSEREACVAEVALSIRRIDLCQLAGRRKDRCLVSIVPLTKDASICGMIADSGYKEDCFIELAGAYKDPKYCDNVTDTQKKAFCAEVALPKQPVSGESGGAAEGDAGGDSNSSAIDDSGESQAGGVVDIGGFIGFVDTAPAGGDSGSAAGDGNATSEPS